MCGICGFVHKKKYDESILKKMNQEIKYRGPDDEGYFINYTKENWQIGFAQRRLAILDLSKKGHQPMMSRDKKLVITYNGEIYNFKEIKLKLQNKGYKFFSETDTEVILYAYREWGIKCVEQFNGMFAFALFDKERDEIYLVRDRMGVKPLYYYSDSDALVFASELKPILKYPSLKKEIDINSLMLYLSTQYITGDRTIFKNVRKLEPGQILLWKNKSYSLSKYWSIENVIVNGNYYKGTYEDAKNTLKNILLDSVNLRMISDVPLGAFLSNGVDSSLIVALMKEVSTNPVKTFTVGFEEKEYDEAMYVRKVAKYFGTEHYEVNLKLDDAKELIEFIPLYFDEPMADPSQIATMLISRVAKQNVTVVLSGDAGDELFCGYKHYSEISRLIKYIPMSKVLNTIDEKFSLKKIIRLLGNRNIDKLFNLSDTNSILNSNILTYWDRYQGIVPGTLDLSRYYYASSFLSEPLDIAMVRDMLTYLPDDILTKVDRASMSVSLETRAPLLDYRVVEFALGLPLEFKYKTGQTKRILKDILYSYIPKEFISQTKKGFGVPYEKWLSTDFNKITKGLLEKEYLIRQGIFDVDTIKKIIEGFKQHKNPNYAKEIWTIFIFQLWYEKYIR